MCQVIVKPLLILVFVLFSWVSSMAATLTAQPYLSSCKDKMALLDRSDPSETIEKKFVAVAQTPEQMLQLIYDYDLVFSDEFANGLLVAMDKHAEMSTQSPPSKTVRKLKEFNGLPESKLDELIWGALDNVVALRAEDQNKAQGQVRFIKGKNLIEALKISPHRNIFEGLMRIIVRDSILRHVGQWVTHDQVLEALKQPPPRWAFLFGSVYRFFKMRQDLKAFEGAVFREPELEMIVAEADRSLRVMSNSVFDYFDWRENQPPMREACQGHRCALSPPQIAYLGDVEIIELEAFGKALKDTAKLWNVEFIENLSASARALYGAPSDLEKQKALSDSLRSHGAHVAAVDSEIGGAFRRMNYYVAALVRFDFNVLNQESAWLHQDQDPDKAELFRAKFQKDLQKLEQVRINTRAISDKLTKMKLVLGNINGLQQRQPQNPREWKELAEEILLNIDELK